MPLHRETRWVCHGSTNDTTGEIVTSLYSHRQDSQVRRISWNGSLIASVCEYGPIEVRTMEGLAAGQWTASFQVPDVESCDLIRGLWLHPSEPWLLVCGYGVSKMLDFKSGAEYAFPLGKRGTYMWLWLSRRNGSALYWVPGALPSTSIIQTR